MTNLIDIKPLRHIIDKIHIIDAQPFSKYPFIEECNGYYNMYSIKKVDEVDLVKDKDNDCYFLINKNYHIDCTHLSVLGLYTWSYEYDRLIMPDEYLFGHYYGIIGCSKSVSVNDGVFKTDFLYDRIVYSCMMKFEMI